MWTRALHSFFFGNYFVGLIALALTAEAVAQLGLPAPPLIYYANLCLSAIAYYSYAYGSLTKAKTADNPRAAWYMRNRVWVEVTTPVYGLLSLLAATWLLGGYIYRLAAVSWPWWWLAASFPAAAAAYYGLDSRYVGRLKLRQIGWLKPLVIGWVWAGVVTVYPVLLARLSAGTEVSSRLLAWFFLKNLLFVAANAILFDIKDYASDANRQLKTLVVRLGLQRTLYGVVMPLTALGMAAALLFGWETRLPWTWILLNQVPFGLTLWLTHTLHKRRPILYYLVAIDGLLLAKAVCGLLGKWLSE